MSIVSNKDIDEECISSDEEKYMEEWRNSARTLNVTLPPGNPTFSNETPDVVFARELFNEFFPIGAEN